MIQMDELIAMAAGNPGAASFLSVLRSSPILETAFRKLQRLGIKGTDLYVLWNDLARRDIMNVAIIMATVPDNILIDACSRQDYSGRTLVDPYLE